MRQAALTLLAAALAAAVTACPGAARPAAAGSGSGLSGALAHIAAGPEARTYLEWSDLRALRAAAGLPATAAGLKGSLPASTRRWPIGLGEVTLVTAGDVVRLATRTGIDVLAPDQAVTIGDPPRLAVHLVGGLDGARIRTHLLALGYKDDKRPKREFLALGQEGELQLSGALAAAIGPVPGPWLDRVVVETDSVAVGGYETVVDEILGGHGPPLSSLPGYAAVASCLESPAGAYLLSAQRVGAAPDVTAVGIGYRLTAHGVEDVLCEASGDRAAAGARAQRLARALALSAIDGVSHKPLRAFFTSVESGVTSTGGSYCAQAVLRLKPSTRATYLADLVFSRAIPDLFS